MSDDMDTGPEPPALRFLRVLVTVLTATMIVGLIVVIFLLVTRWPRVSVPAPEALQMPAGAQAVAITQGTNWWGVVTEDDRFLVFNLDGTLRQDLTIAPAE
ncbi:MAG: DUF6476 family protein [Pseudomonadota bacterium]